MYLLFIFTTTVLSSSPLAVWGFVCLFGYGQQKLHMSFVDFWLVHMFIVIVSFTVLFSII